MKNDLPIVTIITTTFYPDSDQAKNRKDMAFKVLDSWFNKLKYEGEFALHMADDGSEINYNINPKSDIRVTMSRQERKGVGASLNEGFRKAFENSPLAMYLVDDWLLESEIDITPSVKYMMENPSIGIVRIGPPHPGLTGTIDYTPYGWMMTLDRHNFVYAMRPAIYHKRHFDAYGWFTEGDSAVECERKYNLKFCEGKGPDIIYSLINPWRHMRIFDAGEIEPKGN